MNHIKNMKQIILNPVTVTGAGADSRNRAMFCQVLCAYVEFYPGVIGERFTLEIIPGTNESFKKAKKRVRKEAERLVAEDREVMQYANRFLSTERFHFERLPAFKVGDQLFVLFSSNQ